MQAVTKHIKSLLLSSDCVIIPDFGGLVANPHSAEIKKINQRISPPHKALGFNSRLVKNDGLLTHEISIEENIDYKAAVELVKEFVLSIKTGLEKEGRFELTEIGTFYKDVNQNLRFKQSSDMRIDMQFFGLEAMSLMPIQKAEPKKVVALVINKEEKADTPVIPIQPVAEEQKSEEKFPWKKLAIAACLLPFLFYVFWLGTFSNIFSGNDQFQYSDLNPFVEKVCINFDPRSESASIFEVPSEAVSTIELAAQIGNDNYLNHSFLSEEDKSLHTKEFVTIQLQPDAAVRISTDVAAPSNLFAPRKAKGFFIITGCFEFYENATKYVASLRKKGYPAQIVDQKNGLFRIGATTTNNRKEALTELDNIRAAGFKGAWVLSK